jgi:hypothetical protein
MRFDRPFRSGPIRQGIYIDDHVIVCKIPKGRPRGEVHERAVGLLAQSQEAYAKAKLPSAEAKGFEDRSTFVACWEQKLCRKEAPAGCPANGDDS